LHRYAIRRRNILLAMLYLPAFEKTGNEIGTPLQAIYKTHEHDKLCYCSF